MKTTRALVALLGCVVFSGPLSASVTAWPEVTRENKPWTRWWWPGSGVDPASLTAELQSFQDAGLGGVEITPIYGAKGYESRYIDFLTPRWMQMLEHTGREAQRLGLGVDMATGTGWPFGGPWVTPADGSAKLALVDGKLTGTPTKMMVKRAAPGNEGLVVDPYSTDALERYLAPFSAAFEKFPRELIRSQFHDSFEYYGSEWTPGLPAAFRELHGYDIQAYAAELMGQKPADADTLARLKSDYRATLAQLHLDYLNTWVKWSHDRGFKVRNQSHGAPANLLDLYGAVDMAETETFGSTPFPIPGLRRLPSEVRGNDQDLPEPLVMRMASSAGHVMGRALTSSETCTWLREHWKVALSYTKPEIDRLFVNGINHILYHGTAFSPQDAPWPGWLFYASTQFNPRNTWWKEFGELNAYVARVQSILQRGSPDNEVLIYWPAADVWDDTAGPLMQQLGVHNVKWLTEKPTGLLAQKLLNAGYGFDYISDAQLQLTKSDAGTLVTPGSRYKVLLVPATRRMPVATLERLAQLSQDEAKVIFEALPEDVPGLGRLEARRAEFQKARAGLETLVQADPAAALPALGVAREAVADTGTSFIRRATEDGYDYFLSNLTATRHEGWVALGRAARAVLIFDPLTGQRALAASRQAGGGATEYYLQIAPGESLIVRTSTKPVSSNLAFWSYRTATGQPVVLDGAWSVTAVRGGPELPPAFKQAGFGSWTAQGGEWERFGGTARYETEFTLPADAKAADWLLELGEVRESARVIVNGQDAGTAWSLPLQIRVGALLKAGKNTIALEVTNLAANRIRDMDRRNVDWKIMREINFVNISYRPFDASTWDITPAGLLGPVKLVPLQVLVP
jgi:hypothetical protein